MARNIGALIGLGALAVVTAFLVYLSVLHVRPQAVDATPNAAPAPVTSAPTFRAPRPSTVDNIRQILTEPEPVKILVLGDATGKDNPNGQTRWVTLWAQHLAEQRPVDVVEVGEDGAYAEPVRHGGDSAEPIEILNVSLPSSTLASTLAQTDLLIPVDVDLVIFSFGHTEKADQIADDLQALWDKLPAGSMGLVIAQNPQGGEGADGQRERVRAVTGWAQANDVASVNVYEAFTTHTEPLPRLLRGDGITPSDQGSEVWSEAVIATLT